VDTELVAVWIGQFDTVNQVSYQARPKGEQPMNLFAWVCGHEIQALLVPSLLGWHGWATPGNLGPSQRRLDSGLLVLVPHERPLQGGAPEQADVTASLACDLAEEAGASQEFVAGLNHTERVAAWVSQNNEGGGVGLLANIETATTKAQGSLDGLTLVLDAAARQVQM
jgi:hypothetical protein